MQHIVKAAGKLEGEMDSILDSRGKNHLNETLISTHLEALRTVVYATAALQQICEREKDKLQGTGLDTFVEAWFTELPPEQVKQAYVPDVYGKERRKKKGGKEGKLGVEGMPPQVLIEALRRAGATFEDGTEAPQRAGLTKADMLEKGLIGPASAEKRAALQRRLGLPEHLTANGLMEALDTLLTREEFDAL